MTDDPITAMLQQLADHHDQLTQLTGRWGDHGR